MNEKKHISDKEANALIEQYLNNSDEKPVTEKKSIVSKIKAKVSTTVSVLTSSDADKAINNHYENKKEQSDLELIASKGYRAVMNEVMVNGDCSRTRKLLSIFDTRGMGVHDFMEFLNILVKYSLFDKIESYVNHMLHDNNTNKDDYFFFAKGMFDTLPFKNDTEKKHIKKLLKI